MPRWFFALLGFRQSCERLPTSSRSSFEAPSDGLAEMRPGKAYGRPWGSRGRFRGYGGGDFGGSGWR